MAIVKFIRSVPVFDIPIEPLAGLSQLGTPVYDKLIIPAGRYDSYNDQTQKYEEIAYEQIILNDVLLNVNLDRNIAITKITGRAGTVKEFVSNGDYNINVSGKIVSPWQYQPSAEIKKINAIFRVEKEIEVFSRFLNDLFNITHIVIVGRPQVSEMEGSRNTLNISFRAISYEDIKLEVIENA